MSRNLSRRTVLGFSAAGLAASLAGCLGAPTPLVTYDLIASAQAASTSRRLNRAVLVVEPDAIETYDTNRIVVREPGSILSYLPDAQWSDRLPRLIQTRMVQSFQDAGVTNIGRPSDQIDANLALAADIRAFEVNAGQERLATVTLAVRLVDDWNRRILAAQSFSASVPLGNLNAPTVVAGLNQALDTVIAQIVAWTASRA
ncbi:ABC-type transport auxiliary lipoprotein family protein [Pelagibacterium lentulum]|uniref:ABC transporter n=1 Tax=Pelagibacterium lentulum TaxID=2029865 RepID=A0A916R7C6_9HYPH|nr:ABC-type transport auxiliary lipoprotein family protein [Pelagibacterium lentulum]GGA35974.1 ABC transporter [Pelagibacterium lentulum]